MAFTAQQKKEAYKKLAPEVQDFVMSDEATELIATYLKEAGLSEEQSISADSEVLYMMLGLQDISTTITNIANLGGRSTDSLAKLKKDLEDNVLNHITQQP